jgi:hemoglobin
MAQMDISTREDIVRLVDSFYEKVKHDELIGSLFTTVFNVNWGRHLPVMYDFWQNMLFYTGSYSGNPLESHRRLHQVFPLKEEHFNRWVVLFTETVDELFKGERALLAKQRALSIATVMKIKILNTSTNSFNP